MKKGFTLIEIIGVVIILGLISILAMPKIIKMIKTTENDLTETKRQLIISASSQYVTKYQNNYVKKENYNYCIKIRDLVNENLVSSNIIEDLNKDIEIKIVNGNYQYTILDTECKEIYHDDSGASIPELADGMIPVIYSNNEWVYADIYENWYDYDRKEWANAVVLKNNPSKTYEVDDSISMDDIALMFVWVPRYEYIIPVESIGITGTPNAIDIKFIDASKSVADSGYNLHPGFTFGGVNKNGIWVGKFESSTINISSNTVQNIIIKPNVQSWRSVQPAIGYQSSRNIETDYNLTGVDSHMARYLEWTTASYLANSIYGRCTSKTSCVEVSRNDSSLFYTGRSDGLSGSGTTVSEQGTYTYETTNGVLASTTGNIYGIYDMSGCAYEYVMGILEYSNGSLYAGNNASNSGFNGVGGDGSSYSGGIDYPNDGMGKYYDMFTSTDITTISYSAISKVNGSINFSGTRMEIYDENISNISWYGDNVNSVRALNPFYMLGGSGDSYASSGLFSTSNSYGNADSRYSFRTVMIIK